ncbi:unnamed protein product [Protopolystoma xenopodis]|uniref:Uncharacterized protein n=1 Tax=Protopolystoma xenopodis TaxID=117903 RepID=A0A3S5A102_9PLAT|nr:unnamed protein product [Protopolystoma xenopodis]
MKPVQARSKLPSTLDENTFLGSMAMRNLVSNLPDPKEPSPVPNGSCQRDVHTRSASAFCPDHQTDDWVNKFHVQATFNSAGAVISNFGASRPHGKSKSTLTGTLSPTEIAATEIIPKAIQATICPESLLTCEPFAELGLREPGDLGTDSINTKVANMMQPIPKTRAPNGLMGGMKESTEASRPDRQTQMTLPSDKETGYLLDVGNLAPRNSYCALCDNHDYLHRVDLPAYLVSPCYHCRETLARDAKITPEALFDLHLQHNIPWPAYLQARYGLPSDGRQLSELIAYDCKWRSRQPCYCFSAHGVPVLPPCVEFPWLIPPSSPPLLTQTQMHLRSHTTSGGRSSSPLEQGHQQYSVHSSSQVSGGNLSTTSPPIDSSEYLPDDMSTSMAVPLVADSTCSSRDTAETTFEFKLSLVAASEEGKEVSGAKEKALKTTTCPVAGPCDGLISVIVDNQAPSPLTTLESESLCYFAS